MPRILLIASLLVVGVVIVAVFAWPRGWQSFESKRGGFVVELPRPLKEVHEVQTKHGITTILTLEDDREGGFGLSYVKELPLPPGENHEERLKAGLENLRAQAMAKFNAEPASEKTFLFKDKHPALDVEWTLPKGLGKARTRIILARGSGYTLTATGMSSWRGWQDVDQFFGSFKLQDD